MGRGQRSLLAAAAALALETQQGATLRTQRQLRRRQRQSLQELRQYSFGTFVEDFERDYEPGSEEWRRREGLFNASLARAVSFQSNPDRSWDMGVTKFMDYTGAEFKYLLGYKGSRRAGAPEVKLSLERQADMETADAPPASFSLERARGSLAAHVHDQGLCGSCWANAATGALEVALERSPPVLAAVRKAKSSGLAKLSVHTMVGCTKNPRHCGGKGGCEGATSELGFDMVKKRGLPLQADEHKGDMWSDNKCAKGAFDAGIRVGLTGYTSLPSNKLKPIQVALASGQALIASVDGTNWDLYTGGILTVAKEQRNVNHAILLMGYKEPRNGEQGYWLLRNSWGSDWGEKGFGRLEMAKDEEKLCGWDTKTHDGVACDGEPDKAWACGTAGILYSVVYPTGVHVIQK